MSDADYNRYLNVYECASVWRKYTMLDAKLDRDAFRTRMQTNSMVEIHATSSRKNRLVIFHLFDDLPENKYLSKTAELINLVEKYDRGTNVVLITANPFKAHFLKAVKKLNAVWPMYCYRYYNFNLVIPNAPGGSVHRIMSRDEVLELCNTALYSAIENFPKILDQDPQCIWIDADVGDVLEITRISDSGPAIDYRVVIPANISSMQKQPVSAVAAAVTAENPDDMDNEILEHMEDVLADAEDPAITAESDADDDAETDDK